MAIPDWARRGRGGWKHTGRERPPHAIAPGPGQESVWDYPRPPDLVADAREVVVGTAPEVARTERALRLRETASPPAFYVPPEDVDWDTLEPAPGASRCEWKGEARYWRLRGEHEPIAWSYPEPFDDYAALRDHVSFYPGRIACTVAGERVRPQAGGFYGGWITDDVVGPFKGDPGTEGW